MIEPDKSSLDPAVILASIGVPKNLIKDCQEVLPQAKTLSEVRRALSKTKRTCSSMQLLMPVFRPMYENNPVIREKAQTEMSKAGFETSIVDEYFVDLGDDCESVYHLKYEFEIPLQIREQFCEAANNIVFYSVKSYLGLTVQNNPRLISTEQT